MKLERRNNHLSEVRLESRADGQSPMIIGVGAVCYDGTPDTEYELWDFGSERCIERILPGAFDKALSRPDDVRGLFNHSPDHILGRTKSGTMKLSVDAKGLSYEITPGDTSIAKDVLSHLKRGDVTGSSIAFYVDEERWTETKGADEKWTVLREIISLSLADTGPVTFPAYEKTTAGVRAAGDPDEAKRSLEAHRQKFKGQDVQLKGRLASYAARARSIEVDQN
jgi:HK97 family phage prohead protease